MIDQLEAMANQAFIQQSTMPKQGNWAALESMGVIKLEPSDELCYWVQFPKGWRKIFDPNGDHRSSILVDHENSIRARIFYRVTPYDSYASFDL